MEVFLALLSGYGYCGELIASTAAVAYFPTVKSGRVWRIAVAILGLLALSSLWTVLKRVIPPVYIPPLMLGLYDILEYCSIFAYLTFAVWLVNGVKLKSALFLAVGAYSVQHTSYKIAEVVSHITRNAVGELSYLFYIAVMVGLLIGAFFFFRKYFQKLREGIVRVSTVVLLIAGMLLIAILLQYSVEDDSSYYYIYAFYDIISGFLLLFVMRAILVNGELKSEYEMLEYIRWQENEQYELAKKNVEQLDIKLHDIKHLIYGLKGRMSEEDFYDIEKLISVYDMTVKTDNEVLDIIFSQKSLQCEQSNIRFEKVVNGELLSFMERADIYSLFCNAIDNAIEACATNEDEERRIISLMVRKSMNMVHIHLENFFSGSISFKDGLPQTTKEKKDFHGFGMKSIRNIVVKYGGTLNVSAKDNAFSLDILFPLGG